MASIARDKNGTRRILFVAPDGRRPTIRLGKVSQRTAEGIKYRVEQLLEALQFNRSMEADLVQWVTDLEPRMAKRLARVGLIPNPEAQAGGDAGAIPGRLHHAAHRREAGDEGSLVASDAEPVGVFRRGSRLARQSTEADAEDFKLFLLGRKLAPTTVSKRLQFARQFFRAAKKRKLIAEQSVCRSVGQGGDAGRTGNDSSRGRKPTGCWRPAPISTGG